MSIHDIPTTRARAAAILGGRKIQMLEEAGMMVVEIELMRRIQIAMIRAPGPWQVDHDGYTRWYDDVMDPVHLEVTREIAEDIKARSKQT